MKLGKIDNLLIILLYLLVGILPFFPIFSMFIPLFGVTKEIICLFIILLSLVNLKSKVSFNFIIAIFYSLLVLVSVCSNTDLSIETKVNVFRFRCLYALTFALFFNSIKLNKTKLNEIGNNIFKIIFWECIIVAIIGFMEFQDQTILKSIYGQRLTHHRGILLGGENNVRLLSTMGNPIVLGLQMGLAIISAFYVYFINYMDKWNKVLFLTSFILFLFIGVYTYSRTGYIAMAASVFCCVFYKLILNKNTFTTKFISAISIIIILSLLFFMINKHSSFVFQLQRMSFAAYFANPRFILTTNTFSNSDFNIINCFIGKGTGAFLTGSLNSLVFELGYASLFFENGIVGLLCYLFPTFIGFINLLKIKNRNSLEGYLVICFFSILMSFWSAMICEDLYLCLPYSLYFWLSCFILEKYKNVQYA